MTPYRLKRHRKRVHAGDSHMALVPFIDMLTILVVFLLVHTSDVELLPNTRGISIPQSISPIKPRETVVVTITRDEVVVNGQTIDTVAAINASPTATIASLKQALQSQAERVLADGPQDPAEREVTIMGDRHLPYALLKKVMATCTEAQYGKVSLAVLEVERANT